MAVGSKSILSTGFPRWQARNEARRILEPLPPQANAGPLPNLREAEGPNLPAHRTPKRPDARHLQSNQPRVRRPNQDREDPEEEQLALDASQQTRHLLPRSRERTESNTRRTAKVTGRKQPKTGSQKELPIL